MGRDLLARLAVSALLTGAGHPIDRLGLVSVRRLGRLDYFADLPFSIPFGRYYPAHGNALMPRAVPRCSGVEHLRRSGKRGSVTPETSGSGIIALTSCLWSRSALPGAKEKEPHGSDVQAPFA